MFVCYLGYLVTVNSPLGIVHINQHIMSECWFMWTIQNKGKQNMIPTSEQLNSIWNSHGLNAVLLTIAKQPEFLQCKNLKEQMLFLKEKVTLNGCNLPEAWGDFLLYRKFPVVPVVEIQVESTEQYYDNDAGCYLYREKWEKNPAWLEYQALKKRIEESII